MELTNQDKRFLIELRDIPLCGGITKSESKSTIKLVELGLVESKPSSIGNITKIFALTDLGREKARGL